MDMSNLSNLLGRSNAAIILRDQGKYKKSIRLFEGLILEAIETDQDEDTMAGLNKSLAIAYFYKNDWLNAVETFRKSRIMFESCTTPNSESICLLLDWIVQAEWAANMFDDAAKSGMEMLLRMKPIFGVAHFKYIQMIQKLPLILMETAVVWSPASKSLIPVKSPACSTNEKNKQRKAFQKLQKGLTDTYSENPDICNSLIREFKQLVCGTSTPSVGSLNEDLSETQYNSIHSATNVSVAVAALRKVGHQVNMCSCPNCDAENVVKMKVCGRCRKAQYCSLECQKSHWHSGHKECCQKVSPP
jgi:tetratricopeptide (TPR) repeat protein